MLFVFVLLLWRLILRVGVGGISVESMSLIMAITDVVDNCCLCIAEVTNKECPGKSKSIFDCK